MSRTAKRRLGHKRVIPLEAYVNLRMGINMLPWGWQKALIDQSLRCICGRKFKSGRFRKPKADFHHDKNGMLKALCIPCRRAAHND